MAKTKVRKGKRKWYPIQAPSVFEGKSIGETFVYEPEELAGRQMAINLMHLTGNPKKQNTKVFFQVTHVVEGTAKTKTLGLEMQHSGIRRLVRKGRTKVSDSFLAKTKKQQYVRIKPIFVTRKRCDLDTQRAIRKQAREEIRRILGEYSFDTIVNDIVSMRLQRHLKDVLSKIFPIRSAEIRFLKYEEPVTDEDEELEETKYATPRKPRPRPQVSEGIQSLKDELLLGQQDDDEDDEDDDEDDDDLESSEDKE